MIIMIAKAEAKRPLHDQWSTSNIVWLALRLSGSLVGNHLLSFSLIVTKVTNRQKETIDKNELLKNML